ncbi:MAG: flagellar hook-basal body complex protein FliE [Deltaproteobacteria bacterium]|nr:flagellar hook-basal body complex protein FliE [Deltaproteobacteria bacterium]
MEKISVNNRLEIPFQKNMKETAVPENDSGSFAKTLSGAIDTVNQMKNEADHSIRKLAEGKDVDIHQTMISMEKASVSFKLLMQTRNKVIDAYKEMMRMGV